MQDYVLVFAQDSQNRVLLIEKEKPDWQKGRFNLVGGKIEEDESPKNAAHRELYEESGLIAPRIYESGKICGDWGDVYVFKAIVDNFDIKPRPGEIERVFWEKWTSVKASPKLLPNLRVIIPLMLADATDWVIYDEGVSWQLERHRFTIEVASDYASW